MTNWDGYGEDDRGLFD